MDISDYRTIVFEKIQKFEPEHAKEIFCYHFLQNHDEQEMARLALAPDQVIAEIVFKAKTDLQLFSFKPTMMPPSFPPNVIPQQGFSNFPVVSPPSPSPSFQVSHRCWDPLSASNTNAEHNYLDSLAELEKQTQLWSLENPLAQVNTGTGAVVGNDYNNAFNYSTAINYGGKSNKRFLNSIQSEFPLKTCHYYSKGYCRHGNNCKYLHGDSFSNMHGNNDNASNDDQVVSPGTLAQIESEIVELLKMRRGYLMSIASLPMAYYAKYKKVLRADGYLTESQRHGKAGYSLTKLLMQFKSIRLIDRPHGQHAVILAEDAPKYIKKGDSVQNISPSRQIYLTFPADSTFTEEDVADYFNTFGFVEDVRIPCQQKRMFGFVTFASPETVRAILDKRNPHLVCDSQVLVKPYREKAKINERRYQDRTEHSACCLHQLANTDSELDFIPRSFVNRRSLTRRQLFEEYEQDLLLRRQYLAESQFTQRPLPHFGFSLGELRARDGLPHFGFPMEELRAPVSHFGFPRDKELRVSDDHFESQRNRCASNNMSKNTNTDSSEGNSNEGHNLPDDLFEVI